MGRCATVSDNRPQIHADKLVLANNQRALLFCHGAHIVFDLRREQNMKRQVTLRVRTISGKIIGVTVYSSAVDSHAFVEISSEGKCNPAALSYTGTGSKWPVDKALQYYQGIIENGGEQISIR